MGDTAVDFFLETLKQLTTSSKFDSIMDEKHHLQSLEEEIKYLRGFLKDTEKKRSKHSEVMKLVMEIRDVASEAENITEWILIDALKGDHHSFDLATFGDRLSIDPLQGGKIDFSQVQNSLINDFLTTFKRLEMVVEGAGDQIHPVQQDTFQKVKNLSVKLELHQKIKNLFLQLGSVKKEIKYLTTKVKQIYDENIYDINGIAVRIQKALVCQKWK